MYRLSNIAAATGAAIVQPQDDPVIEHLLTDSRKLVFPANSLFFALPGPRRSGLQFIAELYDRGLRSFVVEEKTETAYLQTFPGACFLLVPDVLAALQQLAAFHRRHFDIPVLGITGSNGKTIVKEWTFQLLQESFNTVRSPKSYNSQTGVALSVWQLQPQHTLAIFEAGISLPGEMPRLENMIRPTLGIFTNIGEAHSEGFPDKNDKIQEKLQLFIHCRQLICSSRQPELLTAARSFAAAHPQLELFTWGKASTDSLLLQSVHKGNGYTQISAVMQTDAISQLPAGSQLELQIPFTDDASLENAIHSCCACLLLGLHPSALLEAMHQLRTIEMRLELKKGINQCSVINDSYSADLNSLTIALDFLAQQQQHPLRTVILSDILQSGKSGRELMQQIADRLQRKNIQRLIGIGPDMCRFREAFAAIPQTAFFNSVAEFREQFHTLHFHNESILVKGARLFGFEQIGHLLEEKVHQTVLEVNLSAITHNLKLYQHLLQPSVRLMAMVKAFSYGSGSYEIASLLQFHKIDYLAVAYADEGAELRKAGIQLPIMVMNAEEVTFDMLVQHNLEPELYSFSILSSFENYLRQSGISHYPVHIKLDTGMRRLGFEEQELPSLCSLLTQSSILKVQTVFSHLAASDSAAHDMFTRQQADSFSRCCAQLKTALPYPFLQHIANTSAIHRHPDLQLDMVRLGIGLYGVDGNETMQQQLHNVSTLKTTIAQLKEVKSGESVGYNRGSLTTRDSVIATVRIGYADGYPRNLSQGKGRMWVNGHLVPVIGNVCMDMTMLDVTGVPVQEGDTVVVFGEQLPVAQLAAWSGTIAYEILTGISQRVKRVYYEE